MLRTSDVDSLDIPLPPLPEQRRIVAENEDVFSDMARKGDSLLRRGNGGIHLVGRGAPFRGDGGFAFSGTTIRLPIDPSLVDPPVFFYGWNSCRIREQIGASERATAGIYQINQGRLTRYRIRLGSLPAQQEIARVLDRACARARRP